MKKLLKVVGWILGGLIALGLSFVAIIAFKPLPTYPVEAPSLQIESSPSRLERGAELVSVSCAICHQDESGRLGGKIFAENTPFGTITAPNLTHDPSSALASYTDGELYHLLRTGIKKDGHLALPMMIRMPNLADEDLYSIIAFLRSDNRMMQGVAQSFPEYEPTLLAKALFNFAFEALPLQENIALPDSLDPMAYGKYLVNNRYFCYLCHSESHEGNDLLNPTQSLGYLRGGLKEIDAETGDTITIPSIVIEAGSNVHEWSKEEFIRTLKYGQRPDGRNNRQPMQPYSFMDSLEVNAIYSYLKSVGQDRPIDKD